MAQKDAFLPACEAHQPGTPPSVLGHSKSYISRNDLLKRCLLTFRPEPVSENNLFQQKAVSETAFPHRIRQQVDNGARVLAVRDRAAESVDTRPAGGQRVEKRAVPGLDISRENVRLKRQRNVDDCKRRDRSPVAATASAVV